MIKIGGPGSGVLGGAGQQDQEGATGRLAYGILEGAGLGKNDPRLVFRKTMFAMARKQAGVVQRRRDTREQVTLYLKAFNAGATGESLTQLRYTPREPVPANAKIS